ncbi:RNA methyltransferase tRNA(m5U54)methyltransferase [Cryptotrichosporon argae]
MSSIPFTLPLPGGLPTGHRPHTERTTTILVPEGNVAFLNPVQEYNRDLSVACIRAWNEMRKEEAEARWRGKQDRKKAKGKKKAAAADEDTGVETVVAEGEGAKDAETEPGPSERTFRAPRITILEALSATGLRSIRYAKEIPDVRVILANDLSPSACDAMRQNVALNGVGEDQRPGRADGADGEEEASNVAEKADLGRREGCSGYVRVNEGDACALMYNHRGGNTRVEVVDLDPYGTAAPFIDAAIGSIADGGLLCVTCTDLAVLAGSNYPEKAFSNYGGACVDSEYSHEVALRLVLHSLAQAAARYGRTIRPLLSLSIDFYVRLFVRLDTRPVDVKLLARTTGIVYVCNYCEAPVVQPLGRIVEKEGRAGKVNTTYRMAQGPMASARCQECGSPQHVGGPMWMGPLHDRAFVKRVLDGTAADKEHYGTYARMNGMLTMAHEELEAPFYFTSNNVHGFARASAVPTKQVISALLNAGYKVSRSHAASGSIKTDAPRSFVYDIVREGNKTSPVRLDKMTEGSPMRKFVERAMTHTVDFTPHADTSKFDRPDKGAVFYQTNPLPNWGPAQRAKNIQADKRKSDAVDGGESGAAGDEGSKKAKVEAEAVESGADEEDAINA